VGEVWFKTVRRRHIVNKALILAAGMLASVTLPALGQRPNTRQGFWFSGGMGAGSAGVDCSGCATDRFTGLSGYIRMGGTLGRGRFLLGGETNGWVHSESGMDETMGFGSFVFLWYPGRAGAFFLKFGVGGMSYKATQGGSSFDLTATAPAGSFGLGYDIRIGRNVSLTPYLNSLASSPVEAKIGGQTITGVPDIKLNLVQVGLAITAH
jgi:hypothetical protein